MTSLSQMPAAPAFAGLIVGLAAGAWHFASLRWNGRLLASGRAVAACVLQLARFALTTALLLALARVGALALLAGLAGLLIARHRVVRLVIVRRPEVVR